MTFFIVGEISYSFPLNALVQAQIKESIQAPRHWPLWGEFAGDRWIPHKKMTVMRKMFPFDDVNMLLQDVTKPLHEPMFIFQ